MHEFFEFGVQDRFDRPDVRWLRKVHWENEGSTGFGNQIHQLVFLAGALEQDLQTKLFGKGIGSKCVLFVRGIEDEEFARCDMLLDRIKGRIRFGFRQIWRCAISSHGSVVPLGIEKRLSSKSHGPHGTRWIAGRSSVTRNRQSHVHRRVASKHIGGQRRIRGHCKDACSLDDPVLRGEQPGRDPSTSKGLEIR